MDNQNEVKEKENDNEDYIVGCHRENYLVPNICPVATGNWCRDYVKCRGLDKDLGGLYEQIIN